MNTLWCSQYQRVPLLFSYKIRGYIYEPTSYLIPSLFWSKGLLYFANIFAKQRYRSCGVESKFVVHVNVDVVRKSKYGKSAKQNKKIPCSCAITTVLLYIKRIKVHNILLFNAKWTKGLLSYSAFGQITEKRTITQNIP